MAHEENPDGAGVEIQSHSPDDQQPHVLDAVVVDAVVEPAHAAAVAPAAAPDFYAVGVRLIKMSPVWLLTLTGGFALLLLVLSWVRPAGGDVDAAAIPNIPNDAKSVVVQYPEVPAEAAKPSVETPAAPAAPAQNEHAETVAETKAAEQAQPATPAPAPAEQKPAEPKKEPAKHATPASDADGKFTVQVGSFSVESQANERISSLRAAGFDARSTAVQIPGRGTWYRVQVGRFREREAASKTAAQLREKGAAASSMVVAVE